MLFSGIKKIFTLTPTSLVEKIAVLFAVIAIFSIILFLNMVLLPSIPVGFGIGAKIFLFSFLALEALSMIASITTSVLLVVNCVKHGFIPITQPIPDPAEVNEAKKQQTINISKNAQSNLKKEDLFDDANEFDDSDIPNSNMHQISTKEHKEQSFDKKNI